MAKLDPRLAPAYTVAEAARYLRITPPTVSFGRLVLARLGVTTSVIVDRINAGEEPAAVAKDYGATQDEIMDALAL